MHAWMEQMDEFDIRFTYNIYHECLWLCLGHLPQHRPLLPWSHVQLNKTKTRQMLVSEFK